MPLMIQCQQPIQQFTAGGFGDGETNALFGVVEAVIENKLFTIDMGFSRHKESDAGCSFQRNVDALDALPKLVLKGEEK